MAPARRKSAPKITISGSTVNTPNKMKGVETSTATIMMVDGNTRALTAWLTRFVALICSAMSSARSPLSFESIASLSLKVVY
jgi:hypothetical protein